MLSYVILIAFAILMGGVVYASLKLVANVKPVANCEEGTAVFIANYQCTPTSLNFSIQNNGRFSVGGVVFSVGDSRERTPIMPIQSVLAENRKYEKGFYNFNNTLAPGESVIATLEPLSVTYTQLQRIRVQPFIVDKDRNVIICENAVIMQNLDNCVIR